MIEAMHEPTGNYQELFDPQKPLPDNVVLIHDRGSGTGTSWVFFFLGGLVGLAAVRGVWYLMQSIPNQMNFDFWLSLLVEVGLWLAAWALIRKALQYRRAMAEIAAGTYRYGLFFLDDRLILRTGKILQEWHIDDVVKVHHRRSRSIDRPGHHTKELVLELRAGDGETTEYLLPMGFDETQSELAQRLTFWRKCRGIPMPERYRSTNARS